MNSTGLEVMNNEIGSMTEHLESRMKSLIDGYQYLDSVSREIPKSLQDLAAKHRDTLVGSTQLLDNYDRETLLKQENDISNFKRDYHELVNDRITTDINSRDIIAGIRMKQSSLPTSRSKPVFEFEALKLPEYKSPNIFNLTTEKNNTHDDKEKVEHGTHGRTRSRSGPSDANGYNYEFSMREGHPIEMPVNTVRQIPIAAEIKAISQFMKPLEREVSKHPNGKKTVSKRSKTQAKALENDPYLKELREKFEHNEYEIAEVKAALGVIGQSVASESTHTTALLESKLMEIQKEMESHNKMFADHITHVLEATNDRRRMISGYKVVPSSSSSTPSSASSTSESNAHDSNTSRGQSKSSKFDLSQYKVIKVTSKTSKNNDTSSKEVKQLNTAKPAEKENETHTQEVLSEVQVPQICVESPKKSVNPKSPKAPKSPKSPSKSVTFADKQAHLKPLALPRIDFDKVTSVIAPESEHFHGIGFDDRDPSMRMKSNFMNVITGAAKRMEIIHEDDAINTSIDNMIARDLVHGHDYLNEEDFPRVSPDELHYMGALGPMGLMRSNGGNNMGENIQGISAGCCSVFGGGSLVVIDDINHTGDADLDRHHQSEDDDQQPKVIVYEKFSATSNADVAANLMPAVTLPWNITGETSQEQLLATKYPQLFEMARGNHGDEGYEGASVSAVPISIHNDNYWTSRVNKIGMIHGKYANKAKTKDDNNDEDSRMAEANESRQSTQRNNEMQQGLMSLIFNLIENHKTSTINQQLLMAQMLQQQQQQVLVQQQQQQQQQQVEPIQSHNDTEDNLDTHDNDLKDVGTTTTATTASVDDHLDDNIQPQVLKPEVVDSATNTSLRVSRESLNGVINQDDDQPNTLVIDNVQSYNNNNNNANGMVFEVVQMLSESIKGLVDATAQNTATSIVSACSGLGFPQHLGEPQQQPVQVDRTDDIAIDAITIGVQTSIDFRESNKTDTMDSNTANVGEVSDGVEEAKTAAMMLATAEMASEKLFDKIRGDIKSEITHGVDHALRGAMKDVVSLLVNEELGGIVHRQRDDISDKVDTDMLYQKVNELIQVVNSNNNSNVRQPLHVVSRQHVHEVEYDKIFDDDFDCINEDIKANLLSVNNRNKQFASMQQQIVCDVNQSKRNKSLVDKASHVDNDSDEDNVNTHTFRYEARGSNSGYSKNQQHSSKIRDSFVNANLSSNNNNRSSRYDGNVAATSKIPTRIPNSNSNSASNKVLTPLVSSVFQSKFTNLVNDLSCDSIISITDIEDCKVNDMSDENAENMHHNRKDIDKSLSILSDDSDNYVNDMDSNTCSEDIANHSNSSNNSRYDKSDLNASISSTSSLLSDHSIASSINDNNDDPTNIRKKSKPVFAKSLKTKMAMLRVSLTSSINSALSDDSHTSSNVSLNGGMSGKGEKVISRPTKVTDDGSSAMESDNSSLDREFIRRRTQTKQNQDNDDNYPEDVQDSQTMPRNDSGSSKNRSFPIRLWRPSNGSKF